MKSQKHPSDQRVTPPRFTLIKSMVCGLALLASGQAMAGNQYSTGNVTDFTTAANWDDIAAGCPGTATATVAPTVFDTFNICDTHTITLGAPATADWVSVNSL